MEANEGTRHPRPQLRAVVIGALLLAGAAAFALASLIHFGAALTLGPLRFDDPFPGAATPEAILAVVLGVASVAVLARRTFAWRVALAATVFAFLTTLFGLSVTVGSGRSGDVRYHVTMLVALAVIAGLLLLPGGRRGRGGG